MVYTRRVKGNMQDIIVQKNKKPHDKAQTG